MFSKPNMLTGGGWEIMFSKPSTESLHCFLFQNNEADVMSLVLEGKEEETYQEKLVPGTGNYIVSDEGRRTKVFARKS